MKKIPFIPILLGMVGTLASIYLLRSNFLLNLWLNSTPNDRPQLSERPVLVEKIQKIGELATQQWTISSQVPIAQSAYFLGQEYATTKLTLVAKVEVKAGVDLRSLTEEMIQQTKTSTIITLPETQILSASLIAGETKVFDYSRGLLNLGPDVAPELQTLAQQQAIERATTTACHGEILEQSALRAQTIVQSMIQAAAPNRKIEVNLPGSGPCIQPKN